MKEVTSCRILLFCLSVIHIYTDNCPELKKATIFRLLMALFCFPQTIMNI